MNWVLALIAAVIGAGLSDNEELLGALLAFSSTFALLSLQRLRREVDSLKRELAQSHARAAATPRAVEPPTEIPPAAAEVSFAAAPSVAAPLPPSASAPPPPASVRASGAEAANAPTSTPGWQQKLVSKVKAWFTEGNVPVKIGVIVLLFGVAAALRYAAAQGYFTLPIEIRIALIAAFALLALGLGWRERARRPAFGLSLQGGALGILLLTVFAAYRLYALLPATLALVLVVVLVAGSAALALLQRNMGLAVLGFLGGYLAPVLISTGSGNHVALFSYYAVLNAAVFAISWRQNWRLLNVMGFVFTSSVGSAWGSKFYRPELFASVEPFLVLFFLFYIGIGLLYVIRQTEHRRPWVDGTLVFGTPLVAFPLQAAMLKDDRLGLAFSALVVALVYAALVYWLRRRRGERLLTEAYGVLALGFATLAVPLAFSASTTASVWALEGAGVAWLGLRQQRNLPWLGGLALQLLAAGAYLISLGQTVNSGSGPAAGLLLLNAGWLGALLLAFSGYALSLIHDRHHPRFALPALLFAWATLWWLVGGVGQLDLAAQSLGKWPFAALYVAITVAGAGVLRDSFAWPRMNWLIALSAFAGFLLAFAADDEYGSALATPTLLPWLAYLLALAWALWAARSAPARSLDIAHLTGLWTITVATTMQLKDFGDSQQLAGGWQFVALVAPLGLLSLALWRREHVFAWPRSELFVGYRPGWFYLAVPLLVCAAVAGSFAEGSAAPLTYIPMLNPLELALLACAVLAYGLVGAFGPFPGARRFWPLLAFAMATMATLRAVHHLHGEPWSPGILDSGFTQASLTVVWSLVGVSAWILGSRRRDRRVWTGGLVLMVIVLAKLLTVDRGYVGNLPGIVSFMAVGLLLVGVGYFAPQPPKTSQGDNA